ncbi:MAG TPA: SAV_915 family protein [Streptomyces sp.]|nr:SAV_915 family protein [Streptomyces sp.]
MTGDRCERDLVFVAVRPVAPCGWAVRLFRTPGGTRTAVGFTTRAGLTAALGPDQAVVRLAVPVLRALVEPLGIGSVTIDPVLVTAVPVGVRRAAG